MGTKNYNNALDLVSFSRASEATYTDKDGDQVTASANEPRIDYDENGVLKGLLIEEARTNLFLNSDAPETQVVAVTPNSQHTLSFAGGSSVVDLDETIAATAVDVFVYDTSKDSDGGAWRTGALAQASSWYNETLNTSTRGSRQEFPQVAVIVAEASTVTIYDGDDPSLPMWMVFNTGYSWANGTYLISSASVPIYCIFALNAQMLVGQGAGAANINFLSDRALHHSSAYETFVNGNGPVSQRNGNAAGAYVGTNAIVNSTVNDVAMTVLPDAPIDPATGLPVPTIAVATDGGVSVIKDDGTVASDNHPVSVQRLAILGSDLFSYVQTSTGYVAVRRNFHTRTGVSVDNLGLSSGGEVFYRHNTTPALFPAQANNAILKFDSKDFGFNQGLFRLHEDEVTPSEGMVAYTTSTYNTGWMNGDIKGAFLSDTDDTDLVGNTIYTSDFSSTTDGWITEGAGSIAAVSSELELTGDGGYNDATRKALTTVVGKRYIVQGKFRRGTGATARVQIQEPFGSFVSKDSAETTSNTLVDFTLEFLATGTAYNLKLVDWTTGGGTHYITDVSVK